jgi:hypothetical protein
MEQLKFLAILSIVTMAHITYTAVREDKETCLRKIFDGKLEDVTASRSLWTMLTNPTQAYFFQSPRNAYKQCLKEHPQSRELVSLDIEAADVKARSEGVRLSACIGDTEIEGMSQYGEVIRVLRHRGEAIEPSSLSKDMIKQTFEKLLLIYNWQSELLKEEQFHRKSHIQQEPVKNTDFLKNISVSEKD